MHMINYGLNINIICYGVKSIYHVIYKTIEFKIYVYIY